jgi:hypothetical protein
MFLFSYLVFQRTDQVCHVLAITSVNIVIAFQKNNLFHITPLVLLRADLPKKSWPW